MHILLEFNMKLCNYELVFIQRKFVKLLYIITHYIFTDNRNTYLLNQGDLIPKTFLDGYARSRIADSKNNYFHRIW